MQSGTCIEKAGLRSETTKWHSRAVEKAPFNSRFSMTVSNWTRQSKKLITGIFFPTRQSDSLIGQKRKVERPAAYPYEYHTHKQHHDIRHNPTPQHRLRWLGCCHFCCCSARVSVIFIQSSLRPSAARTSTRWPQCVVSMIFRNCCAGYSFGDFSRNPAPP